MLVVTKADLGAVAERAVRDLGAGAARAGRPALVLAVSSPRRPPAWTLADALDAHRAGLDLPAARTRACRAGMRSRISCRSTARAASGRWAAAAPRARSSPSRIPGSEPRRCCGRWKRGRPGTRVALTASDPSSRGDSRGLTLSVGAKQVRGGGREPAGRA